MPETAVTLGGWSAIVLPVAVLSGQVRVFGRWFMAGVTLRTLRQIFLERKGIVARLACVDFIGGALLLVGIAVLKVSGPGGFADFVRDNPALAWTGLGLLGPTIGDRSGIAGGLSSALPWPGKTRLASALSPCIYTEGVCGKTWMPESGF